MIEETVQLREALSRQLIAVLAADFASKGKEAVERLREKDPSAYLRAVTAVTADMPFAETPWSKLTDDELAAALADVQKARSLGEGAEGGTGAAPERQHARPLSPVPETEAIP